VLVIAFSVFSGFLFLNPSPSYAYIRDLSRANLSRAIADSETIFPDGFDAVEEGVRFQN
jgi:hypothetical protein